MSRQTTSPAFSPAIDQSAVEVIFRRGSLSAKLRAMHQRLRLRHGDVERIAFAHYDAKTDLLKTFIHSTEVGSPLVAYQSTLQEVSSLVALCRDGKPRVIDDIGAEFSRSSSPHTAYLLGQGYRSSLTFPVMAHGRLLGFLFFDSTRVGVFSGGLRDELEVFGQLVALMVIEELWSIEMLANSIQLARDFARLRDVETAAHLDRTARYARLIARELAGRCGHDDEFVEYVFLFAPLHDIGKVGISDDLLLKPGRLTQEERERMNLHVELGLQLIERIIADFDLGEVPNLQLLRNIVGGHHERLDGSGYPRGLRGNEISLEARVVGAADIFDALTNPRSYKKPWSIDEAFAELDRLRDHWLDARCVDALLRHRAEVESIQHRFPEPT